MLFFSQVTILLVAITFLLFLLGVGMAILIKSNFDLVETLTKKDAPGKLQIKNRTWLNLCFPRRLRSWALGSVDPLLCFVWRGHQRKEQVQSFHVIKLKWAKSHKTFWGTNERSRYGHFCTHLGLEAVLRKILIIVGFCFFGCTSQSTLRT